MNTFLDCLQVWDLVIVGAGIAGSALAAIQAKVRRLKSLCRPAGMVKSASTSLQMASFAGGAENLAARKGSQSARQDCG